MRNTLMVSLVTSALLAVNAHAVDLVQTYQQALANDAIYATAKAAGATMLLDIKDMDYGGRAFTCSDLEGHIWSIGTYDPWEQQNP